MQKNASTNLQDSHPSSFEILQVTHIFLLLIHHFKRQDFFDLSLLFLKFLTRAVSLKVSAYMFTKSSHRRCSIKKLFLIIFQNSQESDCARVSFLLKLQVSACNFIKKRLWNRCFAKFLRTSFFIEHLLHRSAK